MLLAPLSSPDAPVHVVKPVSGHHHNGTGAQFSKQFQSVESFFDEDENDPASESSSGDPTASDLLSQANAFAQNGQGTTPASAISASWMNGFGLNNGLPEALSSLEGQSGDAPALANGQPSNQQFLKIGRNGDNRGTDNKSLKDTANESGNSAFTAAAFAAAVPILPQPRYSILPGLSGPSAQPVKSRKSTSSQEDGDAASGKSSTATAVPVFLNVPSPLMAVYARVPDQTGGTAKAAALPQKDPGDGVPNAFPSAPNTSQAADGEDIPDALAQANEPSAELASTAAGMAPGDAAQTPPPLAKSPSPHSPRMETKVDVKSVSDEDRGTLDSLLAGAREAASDSRNTLADAIAQNSRNSHAAAGNQVDAPVSSDGSKPSHDHDRHAAGSASPASSVSNVSTQNGGQSNELAFATRIQNAANDHPSNRMAQPSAQNNTPAPSGAAKRAAGEIGSETATQAAPKPGPGLASLQDTPSNSLPQSAQGPMESARTRAHEIDFHPVEQQATAPATPMKDLSFHMSRADEKVEVRLVEQGGEVHVAVHSADSELTHNLRQGLSELSGKLQESGYHSEMWRPGANVEPVNASAESRNTSQDSRDGQSQSQSQPGWSQQDRGEQNQNGSNKPRWVEELESFSRDNGRFTGVYNGIIS